MNGQLPMVAPMYLPGQEPAMRNLTPEEKEQAETMQRYSKWASMAMESCVAKTVISGGVGFGLGAFFSMMSATFAYDDPFRRIDDTGPSNMTTRQKTMQVFKDMGRGMWRSGKGFAKVGALYSGIECCIEGYRGRNDIANPIVAGGLSGAILARNSGPKAMVGGGLAFAAFSAAIDMYLRREPAEED